jgi:hypothetical protein
MLAPLIRRHRSNLEPRSKERGFTMALVAVALVVLVAMAALSIDIGTLYQARVEAQRAADAAALTAARVISISGITGDPTNGDGSWSDICGGGPSAATLAAINVAQQNLINGVAPSKITVNYGVGSAGASNTTCVGLGADFAVNPVVQVYVQQATLPTFFARVFSLIPGGTFSNSGVSATATAEVFNSSDSETVASSKTLIPVAPRCVKPLIVPNSDPVSGSTFIDDKTGAITNTGVSQLGSGVIGESFTLLADCHHGQSDCLQSDGNLIVNPPQANYSNAPSLQYIPALISGTATGVPSCSTANPFQDAIAGCDQSTVYACGTQLGANADLTENPVNPHSATGDTGTALQCLINATGLGANNGQDEIDTGSFPLQIQAGSDNPLVKNGLVSKNGIITTSSSIVTIPIYDSGAGKLAGTQPQVTIVGFLQLFIQYLDGNGHPYVTVLNVSGCGDGKTTTVSSNPIFGTSPVPIRLITPP